MIPVTAPRQTSSVTIHQRRLLTDNNRPTRAEASCSWSIELGETPPLQHPVTRHSLEVAAGTRLGVAVRLDAVATVGTQAEDRLRVFDQAATRRPEEQGEQSSRGHIG